MDYVEWCDGLADALADYGEQQGRWVNLHQFAGSFAFSHKDSIGICPTSTVIQDAAEILSVCGNSARTAPIQLTFAEIELLHNKYDRWLRSEVPLDHLSLLLLSALNRLSQRPKGDCMTVDYVNMEAVVLEAKAMFTDFEVENDLVRELLE